MQEKTRLCPYCLIGRISLKRLMSSFGEHCPYECSYCGREFHKLPPKKSKKELIAERIADLEEELRDFRKMREEHYAKSRKDVKSILEKRKLEDEEK